MSKRFRIRLVLALALGSAILAVAGDFWVSIQNPSTVTDAVAKNAVPGKLQKQSAELFQRKITAEDVESALKPAAD